MECVVPQGSILDPLLFLLYMNNTGNSSPECNIKMFANDTNLFVFSSNIETLLTDASENISLLNNWFVANKLSVSIEKTCFSVFGLTNDQ